MPNIFELLDHEWQQLGRDRAVAKRFDDVCRLAGGVTSLAEVERFVRQAQPAEADAVLLALVARAIDDDALAARVLLQLLLPGTRSLARRWWALGDHDERAAAAVTAVYHRIRSYPLDRRPGRVAANILMDAAHELRRAVPQVTLTLCADPAAHSGATAHWGGDQPGTDPGDELAQILLDAIDDGILGRDDAALIARSRIAGHRVADIAEHQGLRPRTLWDRRQRAELALAAGYDQPPTHRTCHASAVTTRSACDQPVG